MQSHSHQSVGIQPTSEVPVIAFSSLPLDPNGPPGNAWGRFGSTDQLGTLNFLTPSVVAAAAASEIKTGIRISLDWPLNKPAFPSYGRQSLQHEIRTRGQADRVVNDDVVSFNTQSSSQWDGLRHYGYLNERRYYNDTKPEQIRHTTTLGIDAWASSGGIIGRGVLLDYPSYAQRHSLPLHPFTNSTIPLSHLHALIAEKSITFRPGDILFIRSGLTAAYEALSGSEQRELAERPVAGFLGLEATEDVLLWLWDQQFAAVAGDMPAFEASPVGGKNRDAKVVLHQWLLAGWGMPIGEMFDLEELTKHCQEVGKWSFFLCSVPLKVPGGVASPPNAVAIF